MNLNTIHRKARNLVNDFQMLQDGDWVPDADSIQASLDAADEVKAAFPLIIELAEAMRDTLEWLRTGQVDGLNVDRSALIDDLDALSKRMGE